MPASRIVAAAFAALALAGCGASDSALEAHFRQAISQIEHTHDYRALQAKLRRTLAVIEKDRDERRAKTLAVQGLRSALHGEAALIEFVENDSGNLPAATVDEARAFKFWSRAARLLRKAGAELGVEIGSGSLNGF
jgi:type II secretory pathway component PulJ